MLRVESIVPSAYVSAFILGGNSEFVLTNTSTGNRFAYRVKRADGKGKGGKSSAVSYFVHVQYAYELYMYAGLLLKESTVCRYAQGAKGQCSPTAQSIQVLLWFLNVPAASHPSNMLCLHVGTCGRCGRALTDPLSISIGIGPTCRSALEV